MVGPQDGIKPREVFARGDRCSRGLSSRRAPRSRCSRCSRGRRARARAAAGPAGAARRLRRRRAQPTAPSPSPSACKPATTACTISGALHPAHRERARAGLGGARDGAVRQARQDALVLRDARAQPGGERREDALDLRSQRARGAGVPSGRAVPLGRGAPVPVGEWPPGRLLPRERDGLRRAARAARLVPRAEATYQELELEVDAASGEVRKSTVLDLLGNRTEVSFAELRYDRAPAESAFRFEPEPGVRVHEARAEPVSQRGAANPTPTVTNPPLPGRRTAASPLPAAP